MSKEAQVISWMQLLGEETTFPAEIWRVLLEVFGEVMEGAFKAGNVRLGLPLALRTHLLDVDEEVTIPHTKFALDFVIRAGQYLVAGEIEEGKGARIEHDLLKITAFAKQHTEVPVYGLLIMSDKLLNRNITGGTKGETGFHYTQRVLRLLNLPSSALQDLLLIEFPVADR